MGGLIEKSLGGKTIKGEKNKTKHTPKKLLKHEDLSGYLVQKQLFSTWIGPEGINEFFKKPNIHYED